MSLMVPGRAPISERARKRHLFHAFSGQGWPIADVMGKPAANSDLLGKEIARRLAVAMDSPRQPAETAITEA